MLQPPTDRYGEVDEQNGSATAGDNLSTYRSLVSNNQQLNEQLMKSTLSPLTTIENQLMSITNDVIFNGENLNTSGPTKQQLIEEGNQIIATKMQATQSKVRHALYKLSRVVEDENNLFQILTCAEPHGYPVEIALQAGLPIYFKMICPDQFESPIIVLIETIDGSDIKDAKLTVYGSFSSKEPNSANADITYKDESKIIVADPYQRKVF